MCLFLGYQYNYKREAIERSDFADWLSRQGECCSSGNSSLHIYTMRNILCTAEATVTVSAQTNKGRPKMPLHLQSRPKLCFHFQAKLSLYLQPWPKPPLHLQSRPKLPLHLQSRPKLPLHLQSRPRCLQRSTIPLMLNSCTRPCLLILSLL